MLYRTDDLSHNSNSMVDMELAAVSQTCLNDLTDQTLVHLVGEARKRRSNDLLTALILWQLMRKEDSDGWPND